MSSTYHELLHVLVSHLSREGLVVLNHLRTRRHDSGRVGVNTMTRRSHRIRLLVSRDLLLLVELALDHLEPLAPAAVQVGLEEIIRDRRRIELLAASNNDRVVEGGGVEQLLVRLDLLTCDAWVPGAEGRGVVTGRFLSRGPHEPRE